MVAASKQVSDFQEFRQNVQEFGESQVQVLRFNEIPNVVISNYDNETINLDIDKVEDEMEAVAGNEDNDLSMINETGSCLGPENESASGWYNLIPQDDSIYQIEMPTTFSELDESLDTQVVTKPNIFISQSKTPSRYKANPPPMKHSVKKHKRRASLSLASFKPAIKTKSPNSETTQINGNEIVQAWLNNEFDKKNLITKKTGCVKRGMMATEEVFKRPEVVGAGSKRKVHPKYATISEDIPSTPTNEGQTENVDAIARKVSKCVEFVLDVSENVDDVVVDFDDVVVDVDDVVEPVKNEFEECVPSSKKRKRVELDEDSDEVLPTKRTRTGRWEWVGRWLPRWLTGFFGISE